MVGTFNPRPWEAEAGLHLKKIKKRAVGAWAEFKVFVVKT